ncbi:MAG: invasin domain 3-containing protein, partial [Anaerolineales bacterium]
TNGVAFDSGTMAGAHTWPYTGIPYYVAGDLTVAPSASLTIDPGVEVRFEQYWGLDAQGTLTAEGTATQPITFTGSTKQAGWWDGIYVEGTANNPNINSRFDHVTIEYGGYGQANLNVDYGQLSITNSILRNSAADGFYSSSTAGASTIEFSQITNITDYGVENANAGVTLLADNNWWGSPNGPTLGNTCNPGGSGTRVTGNVEVKPFLTSGSGATTGLAPSAAYILTVSPARWFIPADGVSRAWVTITLTDGSGNPVSGRVVRLNSTLGDVVDGGITNALGQTRAYVTSNISGSAVLTPSLDFNGSCEKTRVGTSKITFTGVANSLDVFPNSQAPYMNDDIQVNPMPVTRGVPTTISAVFTNPNTFPITVTATFGFAQEGIGLNFGPLGEKSVHIAAKSIGTAQIAWTPAISGHYCVQVIYTAQAATGASKQPLYSNYSQRNLDVAPAHLHTFHQRTTLQKARDATNAISKAQTVLDLTTAPENVSGFFIPNYLFSQILDFNFSTWSKATNALAGDPPRSDYQTIATLQHFTFTPAQAGGGVTQARADAANALMSAALDLTAKLNAAEISLDRYSGAAAAEDLDWSSVQASTYLYYSNLAATAMQTTADRMDAMLSELQNEGVPDRVYTAAQIQAYQNRLNTQGFTPTEIQAAQVLQLTSDEIEAIRQERIAADPAQSAGSVYGLLQQMSASLREAGSALLETSPVSQPVPSASAKAQPASTTDPLNLIRTYGESYPVVIRNPQTSSATVQLDVRPVDLPAGWGVSITPITSTLSAGQVMTATLTVNPTSAAVQGMRPRVAVEGYINGQLIGGVVQDILVPKYRPFDGKLRVYLPITTNQAAP